MIRDKINRFGSFLCGIILILVGLLIYSNNYQCSWHFDDLSYIVNNPTIRNLTDFWSIWERLSAPGRTVVLYSFALNYHFGKTEILGYHVVNNAIHIISSVLIYWMTLQLLQTPRVRLLNVFKNLKVFALFVALVFLTHPIQTQAVTYICQRFASLATLFYIASISFYLKGRLGIKNKFVFFVLSAMAAVLGMFSKQITITLPITILLIERLFFRVDCSRGKINWKIIIPVFLFLLIIPALYSFNVKDILSISHKSSGSFQGDVVDAYHYPLTQLRVIPTYIRLLFFPIGQNLLYDFPTSKSFFEWKTFGGFVFISFILVIGYKIRKTKPLLTFGIFWFFLTLLVESSFIPIRHVIFEHRVYLPSIGYAIFLVCAGYVLLKDQKKVIVSLSVFVLVFSYLTYQRNKVWKNEFTLWADVKTKSPHQMRPYLNTGIAYSEKGDFEKAIYEFNIALEKEPRSILVLNNKGIVYTKQHLFDLAILEFNKALEIDQKWAEVWNNRGDAYRHKAEYQQALNDYNKALEINPKSYRTLSNRGVVYSHLAQNELALQDFNNALLIDPDFIEANQNRGNLYGMLEKYELAIKDFTKVIDINPTIPQVYNNRGNAYRRLDKYKLAFDDYSKAIELNPQFYEGYNNRGVIYRHWKKNDLALDDYSKAIALNPDYVKAYNNRGNLLKEQGDFSLALKDFDTALGIEPENKIVYYNRAKTLIGQKDFKSALHDAQRSKDLGYQPADELIKQLNQVVNAR